MLINATQLVWFAPALFTDAIKTHAHVFILLPCCICILLLGVSSTNIAVLYGKLIKCDTEVV